MTEKHIDLADRIIDYTGVLSTDIHVGIREALAYLDRFPYQAPGRTITRSEYRDILNDAVTASEYEDDWGRGFYTGLVTGGVKVAPDPEPTNAEHDRDWWIENANVNDAEDCEACEGDLCPVHHGISMGIDLMAKKIAALGDDPELFALIPDPKRGVTVGDES